MSREKIGDLEIYVYWRDAQNASNGKGEWVASIEFGIKIHGENMGGVHCVTGETKKEAINAASAILGYRIMESIWEIEDMKGIEE